MSGIENLKPNGKRKLSGEATPSFPENNLNHHKKQCNPQQQQGKLREQQGAWSCAYCQTCFSSHQPVTIDDHARTCPARCNNQPTTTATTTKCLVEIIPCHCVGLQFCSNGPQVALSLQVHDVVQLVPEPTNATDPWAVQVTTLEGRMGYLSKSDNQAVAKLGLSSEIRIEARIAHNKSSTNLLLFVLVYSSRSPSLTGAATTNFGPMNAALLPNQPSLAQRVDATGWIRWNPEKETILNFLYQVRPSQVTSLCHWVSCPNTTPNSPGYRSNFGSTQVSGKWLVFFPSKDQDKLDTTWMKIALATVQGRLGCSSKIGGNDQSLVCCVYVSDYTVRSEMKRILLALKKLLGPRWNGGFKPDSYTAQGISGTLYKQKEVLSWQT